MSKLNFFELSIGVGNLEPKLKWFFKLKLKPKNVLLNCHPEASVHCVDKCQRDMKMDPETLLPRPLGATVLFIHSVTMFCNGSSVKVARACLGSR